MHNKLAKNLLDHDSMLNHEHEHKSLDVYTQISKSQLENITYAEWLNGFTLRAS
jgi:hypothetical protein